MRSEYQVQTFHDDMSERFGDGDPRVQYYTACYDACIPKSFWDVSSADIKYNLAPFKHCVLKYTSRLKVAAKHGYSLLFTGDNGAGKTIFTSFVLTQAIRRGRSAYYTTLAQLDVDIKRGFKDAEADKRLSILLDSDFVAIDELGKEHFRADSWLITQLELLLKRRYDDNDPMLLATNLEYGALTKMYGASIESMLEGKYTTVPLESGDYRKMAKARMRQELGIK